MFIDLEREKNIDGCLPYVVIDLQPSGVRDDAPVNWATQSGQEAISKCNMLKLLKFISNIFFP